MAKRILFVGLNYYPNLGVGGPIRVMRSYGLALTSLGHSVTIFCSNIVDRPYKKLSHHTAEELREGMRVVHLNTNLHLSDGLTISLDLLRYLHREIAGYNIVHLFGPRDYFTGAAAIYAGRHGIPYFINAIGAMTYKNSKVVQKYIWDAIIGRRLIRNAKYVVEGTTEQVKDLLAYGIPESKTAVIPWGPDPDLAHFETHPGAFRNQFGVSTDDRLILYLGRIHQKKRIDLVIRALSLLEAHPVRLAVVGHDDDGSVKQLKSLVKDLHLEGRVIWPGPIHAPESASAYRDADVFVLISEHESAPIAMLEACSMGLPVLISDHTGMSGMIHDKAGLVVDMTPEAVADALRTLFRDANLRQKLALGGKNLIEQNFSPQMIGKRLTELYEI